MQQDPNHEATPWTLLSSATNSAYLGALRARSALPNLITTKTAEQATRPIKAAEMKQFW
jgi:hypothetical protein